MLILSKSQSKNYFKKLVPTNHSEDCGCCYSNIRYEIKNRRILEIYFEEYNGSCYFKVTVIAIIKR